MHYQYLTSDYFGEHSEEYAFNYKIKKQTDHTSAGVAFPVTEKNNKY